MASPPKIRQKADIEITPEMIAAGAALYHELEDNDTMLVSEFIEAVLRAALAISAEESGRDQNPTIR